MKIIFVKKYKDEYHGEIKKGTTLLAARDWGKARIEEGVAEEIHEMPVSIIPAKEEPPKTKTKDS